MQYCCWCEWRTTTFTLYVKKSPFPNTTNFSQCARTFKTYEGQFYQSSPSVSFIFKNVCWSHWRTRTPSKQSLKDMSSPFHWRSMVLKNHSVNFRNCAAAVCDSSCSRIFSERSSWTSSSNEAFSLCCWKTLIYGSNIFLCWYYNWMSYSAHFG